MQTATAQLLIIDNYRISSYKSPPQINASLIYRPGESAGIIVKLQAAIKWWYLTHVGKSMQESRVRYHSPSVSNLLRLYMSVHVAILPASLLFSIKMALGSG